MRGRDRRPPVGAMHLLLSNRFVVEANETFMCTYDNMCVWRAGNDEQRADVTTLPLGQLFCLGRAEGVREGVVAS